MTEFNKLYHLILQSIIVEDINSKIKKAIDTLIKSGQLTGEDDPKAQLVKIIIKRNNSIDINGKTKLSQLLKANQKYTNRAEVAKDNYLDNIPEFTQKREYPNGVVTYRVQNSKAGQVAVRKVVDAQWGYDANPWCLISRNADYDSEKYWFQYNAIPKAIAFQNGKLLAFHACSDNVETWWDRNDKSSASIKLLDGKRFKPKPYKFKDIFEAYPKLTLNKETNRYDYDGSLIIQPYMIVDGHFSIPFGVINGDFSCRDNKKLTSLFNGPTQVTGDFDCNYCENLQSLKGGPIKVGRSAMFGYCLKLTSLQGGPSEVGGTFGVSNCTNLQSLKGVPQYVPWDFYCNSCKKITSLQGGPKEVGGYYTCDDCSSLTSLIGAPKYAKKSFSCDATAITTLEGSPREVGSSFGAQDCQNLVSLKGGPDWIRYELYVRGCPKLQLTEEDKRKYVIYKI